VTNSIIKKNLKNTVALVLGGYVNGYSIVKELYEKNIKNIALFDVGRSLARYSNKISYHVEIDSTSEKLLFELQKLNQLYDQIVIYPTDDLQLENLLDIYEEISSFCYLPFNPNNLLQTLDKSLQYSICDKYDIPYPKTVSAKVLSDLDCISELQFPLLIKPSTRKDLTEDVFRTLYCNDYDDYLAQKKYLSELMSLGIEFVISEYIPGDDTNIYAYTCFRSNEGDILNFWTGKKLTQYPDNYGIFSSASNESPLVVEKQGADLVNAMDAYGVLEPEFKYDHRDGKYKLMEVNLRSMMWHRTGSVSGVKIQETQYLYAIGGQVTSYEQDKSNNIHFVLMLHEIPNLIARKGYWKHFKYNVFGGGKREWAIFDVNDVKPFIYSLNLLFLMMGSACLRRLGLR